MRHLKGIPEDVLRETFAYDPASPSGLVRLSSRTEQKKRTSNVYKSKKHDFFFATLKIQRKVYYKAFPFWSNGKTKREAVLEAKAWVLVTRIENPEAVKNEVNIGGKGYWEARLVYQGKQVLLDIHRLIFFLHTTVGIEKKCIIHIDGDLLNNKIENLRSLTHAENKWTMRLSANNTSGVKGLINIEKRHMFRAVLTVEGRKTEKSFSYGANATDAHKESVMAKAIAWLKENRERLHGAFCNHGDEGTSAS
jgi:hypothetical protein